MFTIRHYQTPNQVRFVTLKSKRTERIRRQKQTELKNKVLVILAVLFMILALGYVGKQDQQYNLINAGYSLQKASK